MSMDAVTTQSIPLRVAEPARSNGYAAYLRRLRRDSLFVQSWQVGLVLAFLVVWEVAPRMGWINPMLTSYPTITSNTITFSFNEVISSYDLTGLSFKHGNGQTLTDITRGSVSPCASILANSCKRCAIRGCSPC